MGWTSYNQSMPRQQALEELRNLHQWENPGEAFKVLADGITGSGDGMGYYAAVRRTDRATGESVVFCAVALISLTPFGYKEMSESMGPRIHAAPREVLEALEPLPARAPKPCSSCGGSGDISRDPNGPPRACFMCEGAGQYDRHDCARRWRKAAWARFGGQPQGRQLQLV